MAKNQKELTINPASWSAINELFIGWALGTAKISDIKKQVENGACLFEVKNGNDVVCAFVLRVDVFDDRSEGVVVAAGGNCKGVDLTATVLPAIEKMFTNCQIIRIHTGRVGLAKKLEALGYKTGEIVLTKKLGE